MTPAVHDNAQQHRFEVSIDGMLAHCDYRIHGSVLTIVHTEVPAALGGRGIGGALVQAALDRARAHGMKVDPVCEYAKAYMAKHPEAMVLHV